MEVQETLLGHFTGLHLTRARGVDVQVIHRLLGGVFK